MAPGVRPARCRPPPRRSARRTGRSSRLPPTDDRAGRRRSCHAWTHPHGDSRARVERHLLDYRDAATESNRSARRVLDLDHPLEQLHRAVVTAFGGQLDGPSELERRGRDVALPARREPLLDAIRELGLAGVVRDLYVDLCRQLLVVGPDRLDERHRASLVSLDETGPAGEHLVARLARWHVDAD